jgi:hypothetical protein
MRLCSSVMGVVIVPRQAEVEGERWGNAPVVFDEGPVDLPAAAGGGAVVGLVVDGASGQFPSAGPPRDCRGRRLRR